MKFLRLIFCGSLWILLVACALFFDRNPVPEETQNFHFNVPEETLEQIPYALEGEKGDWRVRLEVREASDAEKELMMISYK